MTDFESPQDPITINTAFKVTQRAHWLGRRVLEHSDPEMLADIIRDGSRAVAVFNQGLFGVVSDIDGHFFSFPRTPLVEAHPEDDTIMFDFAPSSQRNNPAPPETALEIEFYAGGTVEVGACKMRRVAFLSEGLPMLSDEFRIPAAESEAYRSKDWRQLYQQEGEDLTADLGDLSHSLDAQLGLIGED